jgi:hypothetical protein
VYIKSNNFYFYKDFILISIPKTMSGFHLGRAPLLYIISQIIVILFFGLFTQYGHGGDPKDPDQKKVATKLLNTHYA